MEDLSLDFTEYLSQRLAMPRPQVSSLLGRWLLNYEPASSLDDQGPSIVSSPRVPVSASLQATG